jgi:serine/threonine-protein kinase
LTQESAKHENTVVFLVAPGDVLDDRWQIESRLGQGAMGSVFKGIDLKQNRRPVAIKILAPEHCRKPKVLARFEREAKLMTTLRHPNIIQLFGVGRRGALPYIAMQYLEGMTLYDVLKTKGGKLTPGETMLITKQVAAGLSFIHHHGLVHRDIKPQNIFVSPGARVTILDLGVARDKSNPGLTKPGAMVGTPYYMSPEQIAGTEEIDKRTDVYALASMTFELLVGRPPFLGANNFEVLYAHKNNPPPDASLSNKNLSKDVGKVLMAGMAKKREERPDSATELNADLEAFFGSEEKVDVAKAFGFLDDEAARTRQKEAEKAKKRAASAANAAKSTRAVTAPQLPRRNTGDVKSPLPPPVDPSPYDDELESTEKSAKKNSPSDTESGDGPDEPGAETDALSQPVDTNTDPSGEVPRISDGRRQTMDGAPGPPPSNPVTHTTPVGNTDPESTFLETGELRVVTTVKGLTSGCNLFIDDKPMGATPQSLNLPEGRHVVRVERQGFKPVEREVKITASQVTLVRVELSPPTAK